MAQKLINTQALPTVDGIEDCPDKATKIIVRYLASLPEERLQALAKTQDQIELLRLHKLDSLLCSQYWSALLTFKNDPLEILVDKGEISENDREHIILQVSIYQRLWELIQISERYIRSKLERIGAEYPWTGIYSSASLMGTILKYWVNGKSEAILQPYFKASVRDKAEMASFSQKLLKGDKIVQPSKIKPILAAQNLSQKQDSVWFPFVLSVCREEAKRNRMIEEKLKSLEAALYNLACFEEREAKQKRPSKKMPTLLRSYEVRNGVIHYAHKKGGVYA